MKSSGVYIIYFIGGNRIYIGSTKDFVKRKSDHLVSMRLGKHSSPKMNVYFNRYGECNFRMEIIEELPPILPLLKEREQWYMDEYIFAKDDEKFRLYAMNICPEAYSIRGRKVTANRERKSSKGKDNHFFGKKHKESSKQKMSLAKRGRCPQHILERNANPPTGADNPGSKPVYQLTLENEIVALWANARDADRETGKTDYRLISAVCLGKRKSHFGCKWMYVEDYNKLSL